MYTFLLYLALATCVTLILFFGKVSPYTGVVISIFGKPWRSHGPGLFFRIPGMETVDEVVSLRQRSLTISGDFEPDNEEAVSLTARVEYHALYSHLLNFVRFDEKKDGKLIEAMLKDRIKSIFSYTIRICKDRDDVMDGIKVIGELVKEDFEKSLAEDGKTPLQDYYGVNVEAIIIADPELPQALKEAAVEREVMEKRNLTRALEMKKIKSMAASLVKEAERHGQKLNFETALETVMINLGRIKKENRQFGLSKDTLATIDDLLPKLAVVLKGGK